MARYTITLVLSLAALSACACGSDSSSSSTDAGTVPDGYISPHGTSLFVQVFAASGNPVATAAVTVAGTVRTADSAGRLLLDNLSPGRLVARVEARGFTPASVVVDLAEGAHVGIEVGLLPVGAPIMFDASETAFLTRGPVRIVVPAGSLVDHNGEPVTGARGHGGSAGSHG